MSYSAPGVAPFVRVCPKFVGYIAHPVDDIWRIVKQWAPSLWIRECGGVPVEFHVLTGDSGEQVGATRASVVGEGVVVEQLVAVDADEHYLTWKCISDPRSINPFPGSFLNYINTLRFTGTTDGKQSIVHWEGEFWTDADMADTMCAILADFYQDAINALDKQLTARRPPPPRLENGGFAKYHDPPASIRTLQQAFGNSFR